MSTLHNNPYFLSSLSGEGQIRLLKVQPEADGSQDIQCELETVNLKDNPSYVALSYTWGPPTAEAADSGVTSIPTYAIRCNGYAILITKNLYDFIWRFRHNPELNLQRLWVDSICINQQDPVERSTQVSFMASIYHSADTVIAWLGEEDVYTQESFALIRTLATLCKDCSKQIMPKNMSSEAFGVILGPLADDRVWNSLRRFWRRRYFRRTWIIQEVALAKKVIAKCGSHILDWDYIVEASRFLTVTPWARFLNSGVHEPTDREYSNHALPLYLNANSKLEKSGRSHALLYALVRARRFECSDLRDKVYALLGLGADHTKGKPRLQPVYGDRSVIETYVSTAIQILEDADDLLLLAQAEGRDFQKIEGLPSWVPDWSCTEGLGLGIVGYERFTAAGNLPRSLGIDESHMSLAISGLRLDRVVQVGESKDEALIHRKPPYFPGWISILSALPPVYHNGQPKSEVFWRTLVTDTASRFPHPVRHPAAEEYRFAFCHWITRVVLRWMEEPPSMEKECFLEGLNRLSSSDETRLFPSIADKLHITFEGNSLSHSSTNTNTGSSNYPDADDYDAILNFSSHTRLLRTSTKYLGLATTSVREGDSVWILPGSRVPLILREAGARNEYHLVGGAYIHGFMQGEALMSDAVLMEIKVV
ncbi:heterokaryon incompatibility protein-domain-containing protein [Dendryphion nanum]|uniref:Heterokaryon incompatibility protein-domain-containing protein n=1 Tax=Dendryphion nanum TaxID=256645 RepID=A0A9P9D864_9PLEO|nr:heterokaryon incompatibility protein-domain-containing protein [Dendryphion nanum]